MPDGICVFCIRVLDIKLSTSVILLIEIFLPQDYTLLLIICVDLLKLYCQVTKDSPEFITWPYSSTEASPSACTMIVVG